MQIMSELVRAEKLLYRSGGTHFGDCFINTCCEWLERKSDDICGLDSHRISASEKARLLVDYSVLKEAFERVGL